MVRRTMVSVGDDELEVEVAGTGEPVVVIQTALTADELWPLAQRMSMRGGYRVIHLHRRGYADSAPVRSGAGRGGRCGGLPRTDGHPRSGARLVCVVGASYSSAIALTLASTAPQYVRTLTVIEAPPVHVPSAPEFRSASEELVEASRAKGAVVALDEFMTKLVGPTGAPVRTRPTRFGRRHGARRCHSRRVRHPRAVGMGVRHRGGIEDPVSGVLYVGGSDSGPVVRGGPLLAPRSAPSGGGRHSGGSRSPAGIHPSG